MGRTQPLLSGAFPYLWQTCCLMLNWRFTQPSTLPLPNLPGRLGFSWTLYASGPPIVPWQSYCPSYNAILASKTFIPERLSGPPLYWLVPSAVVVPAPSSISLPGLESIDLLTFELEMPYLSLHLCIARLKVKEKQWMHVAACFHRYIYSPATVKSMCWHIPLPN